MKAISAFPNRLFKEYVYQINSELSVLSEFKLGEAKVWELDWTLMNVQDLNASNARLRAMPVYDELLKSKNRPCVYFFTIDPDTTNTIFDMYSKVKTVSSEVRKSRGVRDSSFFNLCHVNKQLNPKCLTCLYVGSVSNNMHTRFLQHLGMTGSGRTGALYLSRVFAEVKIKPLITFNYYVLDSEMSKVVRHIECVLYDQLVPMLGKRAL